MELSWIKSFLSIAHTRNFTESARECHITQPAFSRRIRAIENWAGVSLIDRSTYPTRLTPDGERFLEVATDVDRQLATLKSELRNRHSRIENTVRLVVQHSLALDALPTTLPRLEYSEGNIFFSINAENFHNCVELLQAGNADIMICFSLPQSTASLDLGRLQRAVIGQDVLIPVTKPARDGDPGIMLANAGPNTVPWLSYGSEAMLNHGVSRLLDRKDARAVMRPVIENPISEVLRRFALAGMGLAWLPRSLVDADVRQNRLVVVADKSWQIPLEIHAYRLEEEMRPIVESVWTQIGAGFGVNYALGA